MHICGSGVGQRLGQNYSDFEAPHTGSFLSRFFLNFSISLVVVLFLTPPSGLQDLSFLTGSEPGPSAVKARNPNCWTTREFPVFFLNSVLCFLRQEDSGLPSEVSVSLCSCQLKTEFRIRPREVSISLQNLPTFNYSSETSDSCFLFVFSQSLQLPSRNLLNTTKSRLLTKFQNLFYTKDT